MNKLALKDNIFAIAEYLLTKEISKGFGEK